MLPCIYLWYFSYIFGILPYIYLGYLRFIYLSGCRTHVCGIFRIYIYIYLDYCRKAHTGIYICGIIRVYIFGLLPQTDTYLWYCHIHIGRASVDIFVLLPQYLPIYWLYCRIYLFS